MKLTEIMDSQFQLSLMAKLLRQKLPASWLVELKDAAVMVRPRTNLTGWVTYNEESDSFTISYYRNGARQFGTNEIDYDQVVREIQHDFDELLQVRESQDLDFQAPLIWRAIKHATEVEKKRVWSDIPGGEGEWFIRYGPGKGRRTPLAKMNVFYVKVYFNEGGDTWFEILPEDDVKLEIHPSDRGYEIVDPTGTFTI